AVFGRASHIFDAADRLHIKSKEMMGRFFGEFKRIAGNNIGSIGHDIEEVIQKSNRALHEKFLEQLRRKMGKPNIGDSEQSAKLRRMLDQLYKPNARIGSGSTADAIRHERLFVGEKVGGKEHIKKGNDFLRGLKDWLEKNPTAPNGDKAAAENIIKDLEDALFSNPMNWR
ncbi:MAG: type IV secretion protein Rhs, partial [Bdellovibrionia bacterium]